MSVYQKHPAWLVPALVLVVFAFSAAPALASSPVLAVNTVSLPTNLPPGGEGELLLQISNLGDAPANGETSPIAIAEKLPAGLVATAISVTTILVQTQNAHSQRCTAKLEGVSSLLGKLRSILRSRLKKVHQPHLAGWSTKWCSAAAMRRPRRRAPR